jgi:hypothetical protein
MAEEKANPTQPGPDTPDKAPSDSSAEDKEKREVSIADLNKAASETNKEKKQEQSVPSSQEHQGKDKESDKNYLELVTAAGLDVVGTENYLRYGVMGPLRYVTNNVQSHTIPETLDLQLRLLQADETAVFEITVTLQQQHHEANQRTVWAAHVAPLGMQLMWAWDFFRMLSYVQLRVEADDKPWVSKEQQSLFEAVQKVEADWQLVFEALPKSGQIHQVHHLEKAAYPVAGK